MDTCQALLQEAGLPKQAVDYLIQRGFTSVKLLARAAPDEDLFTSRIIQPFLDGIELTVAGEDGTESKKKYEFAGDEDVCRAAFLVAWDEARLQVQEKRSPVAPLPAAPQPAPTGGWHETRTPRHLKLWRLEFGSATLIVTRISGLRPGSSRPTYCSVPRRFWPVCCGS